MIGRRRQTAPIKSPTGATTGRRSSSLSIPARTHGFYYPHLQPGRTLFGHWNGEAADNATRRLRKFLDRHVNGKHAASDRLRPATHPRHQQIHDF